MNSEQLMDGFVQDIVQVDADEKLEAAQVAYKAALEAYHVAVAALEGETLSDAGAWIEKSKAAEAAWQAECEVGIAAANAVSVRAVEPITRAQLAEELRVAIGSKARIEKSGVTFEQAILRFLDDCQKRVDGGFYKEHLRECKAFKSHFPWGRRLSLSRGQRDRAWAVLETHCVERDYTPVRRGKMGVPLLEQPAHLQFEGATMFTPPYQLCLRPHGTMHNLQVVAPAPSA